MKDARGNTHTYAYNANGDRIQTIDPLPRTTNSFYNNLGQKTSDTNARGFVTTYLYDELSRMTRTIKPLGKITHYEYDANGNKTAEVDALNRRTTLLYDASDRLIKTTFPDNTFTEVTYDFRNKKLTEKDELGRVTKYEYDRAGQLKKVTKAFGTVDASVTEYTYDLAGRKLTEKDPRGNITTYGYDQAGRMTSMTNANGKRWDYQYDNRDRRTRMTDPRQRVTQYTYDGRGRQTRITYPDNTFVDQTYDPMGLMLSRKDQENKTSYWAYDAAGRLKTVTDALGNVTEYTLDATNNKTQQKDARNSITSYEWDALNRRTKRCLPLGMCETMTYDLVGNMLTRTDFNLRPTAYSYDLRNRQLTVAAAASAFPTEPGITRTYTATGKVASMLDSSGATTWAYDNQDRVLTKSTPQGALTYTYLPNSLVASVNSSNANGYSANYAYDALNRLTGVTDNRLGNTTTNTYDDANNLATIAYPNGVVHAYTVDPKDQVIGLQVAKIPAILATYNYARRNTGAISTVAENTGRNVTYTYDDAWRLTNEYITGDPVSVNNGNLTYLLDAVANRTTLISTLAALTNQSFLFDANDRITTDTSDANGNTLTSSGKTYTYDFLDRLTTATGGISFVYDGDGNRVARTAGGVTTRYLIDDQTPLGYTQVAEELSSNALTRRYTYGLQRISQTQASSTTYYLYDGSGSTRALVDATGAIADTFAYDAFGNLIARTGTTSNDMLYRGEQLDSLLGAYYLRARWYSPGLGRFFTADVFEGTRSEPASLHKYVYAHSDPIQGSDPSGYRMLKGAPTFTPVITTGARLAARRRIFLLAATGASVAALFLTDFVWDALCAISKAGSAVENASAFDDRAQGRPQQASMFVDPCKLDDGDDKDKKKKCSDPEFETLIKCSELGYSCDSESEARQKLQRFWPGIPLRPHNRNDLPTGGPCSIDSGYRMGTHTNMRLPDGGRAGSIVSCPCCEESQDGARERTRWEAIR